jgi:hypothetical protein
MDRKGTDRNGSETRKLCMKQDCKDLYVINYSFQGLAGKICKTQKIVLEN